MNETTTPPLTIKERVLKAALATLHFAIPGTRLWASHGVWFSMQAATWLSRDIYEKNTGIDLVTCMERSWWQLIVWLPVVALLFVIPIPVILEHPKMVHPKYGRWGWIFYSIPLLWCIGWLGFPWVSAFCMLGLHVVWYLMVQTNAGKEIRGKACFDTLWLK